MRADIGTRELDELISKVESKRTRGVLRIISKKIEASMAETESKGSSIAWKGDNPAFFWGRFEGLNHALCCMYFALCEEFGAIEEKEDD